MLSFDSTSASLPQYINSNGTALNKFTAAVLALNHAIAAGASTSLIIICMTLMHSCATGASASQLDAVQGELERANAAELRRQKAPLITMLASDALTPAAQVGRLMAPMLGCGTEMVACCIHCL